MSNLIDRQAAKENRMAKFTVLPKEKYDEIYNRASEDCVSRQAAIDAADDMVEPQESEEA